MTILSKLRCVLCVMFWAHAAVGQVPHQGPDLRLSPGQTTISVCDPVVFDVRLVNTTAEVAVVDAQMVVGSGLGCLVSADDRHWWQVTPSWTGLITEEGGGAKALQPGDSLACWLVLMVDWRSPGGLRWVFAGAGQYYVKLRYSYVNTPDQHLLVESNEARVSVEALPPGEEDALRLWRAKTIATAVVGYRGVAATEPYDAAPRALLDQYPNSHYAKQLLRYWRGTPVAVVLFPDDHRLDRAIGDWAPNNINITTEEMLRLLSACGMVSLTASPALAPDKRMITNEAMPLRDIMKLMALTSQVSVAVEEGYELRQKVPAKLPTTTRP